MDGRRNSWTMGSGWHVRSVADILDEETVEVISLWAVYDHPRDYPNNFVARLWESGKPTPTIIVSPTIEAIREALAAKGLSKINRYPEDDALIREVWL